jgi:aquaporin TIP
VKTIGQQLIAEVVGTFALVFIGAGSVIIAADFGGGDLVAIALAHGLVLAIMVSSLGHISGAHFNPAVTLGVWVAGKIETIRAGAYILAQLAGAAAGAGLLRLALPTLVWKNANLGATLLNRQVGITVPRGILIEGTLTFFLVFVVFAAAIDDRGVFKSIAGLPIGLVLAFDILAAGPLTGASMNPARTFGPALVGGTWTDFWVYVVGPVSGAIVAAILYWGVFLRGREVHVSREETPIGGGPEEDLPGSEPDPEQEPSEA